MSVRPAPELIRRTFPVPPLSCNCSIIGDPVSRQAIVVDPGGAAERILQIVNDLGLTIVNILHTHAHFDHFLASGEVKRATGAALCLHQNDAQLWNWLETQCRLFGVPYRAVPAPDHLLCDDEKVAVGAREGRIFHTPGHTPGSICLHFASDKLLLSGDTLFRGGIGRTDLWGGNYEAIEGSIRERLYTLDESTVVVTGHGPETQIGLEREYNPFVRAGR